MARPAQADETVLKPGLLQPTWPGRALAAPTVAGLNAACVVDATSEGRLALASVARRSAAKPPPAGARPRRTRRARSWSRARTTGFPRCRPGSPAARPPRGAACLPDGTRSEAVGNVREACRSPRRSPPAARSEHDRRPPGLTSGTRRLSTTLRLADSALALRNSLSDTVQPARHTIAVAQRSGLLHKHQKGRLKSILRGMRIVKNAPANAQNHRAVPDHQGPKRGLPRVAIAKRLRHQLTVRPRSHRSVTEQRLEVARGVRLQSKGHGLGSPAPRLACCTFILP